MTTVRTIAKEEGPGAEDLLFSLLWLIPASLVKGFVLSKLWSWFVVPTFHIATLSIATAIGIGLIVTMLVPGSSSKGKNYGAAWMFSTAVTSIAGPFFILFVGWVVLHFQ